MEILGLTRFKRLVQSEELWFGKSEQSGLVGFSAQQQHDVTSEEKTLARRPHPSRNRAFVSKGAVPAIKGEKILIELAQDSVSYPNRFMQSSDRLH